MKQISIKPQLKMAKIKYNSEDLKDHHGVAAVIKDKNESILMQEHVKYGFWTIPVGKVVDNQRIIDGLKQELDEECNITVINCKELIVKDYTYNRNGIDVTVHSHLFEIIEYSGEVKNNEPQKHKQQIFLSIDEIMRLPYLSDLTILYLKILGFERNNKI
jgi:ADP-ribose pyrophosphatase YjhB (NUDIX family)